MFSLDEMKGSHSSLQSVIFANSRSGLSRVIGTLERHGCETRVVSTASEAIQLCRTEKIGLAIVFLYGKMTGEDFVNAVHGDVSIILITPFPDLIVQKVSRNFTKSVSVLRKPINLERFEDEVRRVIGRLDAGRATAATS